MQSTPSPFHRPASIPLFAYQGVPHVLNGLCMLVLALGPWLQEPVADLALLCAGPSLLFGLWLISMQARQMAEQRQAVEEWEAKRQQGGDGFLPRLRDPDAH